MTADVVRVSPDWLQLREPADAAARSGELVEVLRGRLPLNDPITVHDLGCGTGSMLRWLSPHLPGPQHWVMYDRDPELLALVDHLAPTAADGSAVTTQTRTRDITQLPADDLDGATLITASALLDMFTADELERFVASCVRADCPALMTISVIGRVSLHPIDALDERITEAFNAHQRRTIDDRLLLGPDAVALAGELFTDHGFEVLVRPSHWALESSSLTAEWLAGWLDAACEADPGLMGEIEEYRQRRIGQLSIGTLRVTVQHHDLLASPQ
jgi:SAM-dependent methyltransferase